MKNSIAGSHLFYLASAIYKSQKLKNYLKTLGHLDRYFYSTMAYHKAKGSNLKISLISDLLKLDYGFY